MRVRLALAALACVACCACRAPEPAAPAAPPAPTAESPELPAPASTEDARFTLARRGALEGSGALQAWAFGAGGRVARVDRAGALSLEQFYASAERGSWRVHGDVIEAPDGVVGAAWAGPVAATLHTGTRPNPEAPATDGVLNLWHLDAPTQHDQVPLTGAPVDVFLDTERSRAWVLTRVGREGRLAVVSLAEGEVGRTTLQRVRRPRPGVDHVHPASGQLAVISFDERAAYVFGLARPALLQRVALDARPATALFGVDGALLVAPANQAIARTIDLDHGADGQVNPLPSPMTRWALGADDASVYGVAAGASSVHRFAWPYLQERRVRDAWPEVSHRVLPIAVAATEAALFVADAAPGASRLWALDPDTLEVRASVPLPATPADVVAFEGDALVVFPESGAVLRFGLVAEDAQGV